MDEFEIGVMERDRGRSVEYYGLNLLRTLWRLLYLFSHFNVISCNIVIYLIRGYSLKKKKSIKWLIIWKTSSFNPLFIFKKKMSGHEENL